MSPHHLDILSIADFHRLCQGRLFSFTCLFPHNLLHFHNTRSSHITLLQTSYRESTDNLETIYRQYADNTQTIYRQYTDNLQTIYRDHTENLQKIQRESTHNIQTRYSDSQTLTNLHKAYCKTSNISADNRRFRKNIVHFYRGCSYKLYNIRDGKT